MSSNNPLLGAAAARIDPRNVEAPRGQRFEQGHIAANTAKHLRQHVDPRRCGRGASDFDLRACNRDDFEVHLDVADFLEEASQVAYGRFDV